MSQHSAQDLVGAIARTRNTKDWLVVVTPNDESLMAARRNLAAALTPEDRFSGRTASLDGGGMISIVNQADEPFQPEGQDISVLFMGQWADKGGTAGMARWRDAATHLL